MQLDPAQLIVLK